MGVLRGTRRVHFTMLAAAAPFPIAALILVPSVAEAAAPRSVAPKLAIVLVHSARSAGSSWHDVVRRLLARTYPVLEPPNPLRSPVPGSDADALGEIQGTGL